MRRFSPGAETPAAYASFLRTQLDDPDAAVLVADADGSVIGYAYAVIEGPDFMALRGPAGVLHDCSSNRGIAVAASGACWYAMPWRSSPRAARRVSCCRRRSRTNRRSGSSPTWASGGR